MGNRVQRVKTDISEDEMVNAIIKAWSQLFGSEPAKEQVGLVLAQNNLETGHRKSMYNYNVGNLTTNGKNYNYYDDITTDEQVSKGVWEKKNLKYRAYDSLAEGVTDYLKFLSKPGGRYSQAWQHILDPDPESYSKALKAAGYYTANEIPYTKDLKSLFNKYTKSDSFERVISKIKQNVTSKTISSKDDLIQVARDVAQMPEMQDLRKQLSDSISKTPQIQSMKQEIQQLSQQDKSKIMPVLKELLLEASNDRTGLSTLNNILDVYVESASKFNRQDYVNHLKNNNILIKVNANNTVDGIEFSNILCSALDEELQSKSFIHTNGSDVEIECSISGPRYTCYDAVKEVSKAVANKFSLATKKIGSVKVSTDIVFSKSSYPIINLKTAELNHRKFLLKFCKGFVK